MQRSGTAQGTLGEVWDGSEDTREGPGRVGKPSKRFAMGWGTIGEI